MATKTLGTNATTSLNPALMFTPAMAAADQAAMGVAVKDDQNVAHPTIPDSFTYNGFLYVPGRGKLLLLPGDWVGVDSTGWPILVSANAIANGPWTHT